MSTPPKRTPLPHGTGFSGVINELSSKSTPAWKRQVKAKPGSPNVILLFMDDMGFSDISPFGSEIDTPNIAALAESGLTLTNYHTAPVCSPARASLMTGLNPHRAGFAHVANFDAGYPNWAGELPPASPTIAESFRASGYATFMVGKWHLTKHSKMHDGAEKSSWPVQRGFDHYFGSLEGFTTMFHPHRLVSDNSTYVREFEDHEYLTDVLTDQAREYILRLRSHEPEKPFFLYFAHTAVHAPLQAKPEDIEKYKDKYNEGWEKIRKDRFLRQKQAGIISAEAELPQASNPGMPIKAWDELSDEEKQRYARYMAVYAGAVDNVDQNLGRLLELLDDLGERENTIIAFTSDNGASGEGGSEGTRSYFSHFGARPGRVPSNWEHDVPRDLDLIGGPQSMVHYPTGWAAVSSTPYRYYKGTTFNGGIRAPLIISWPAGISKAKDDDGIRNNFSYVADLGMTLLDLAGVTPLLERNGKPAPELDGKSFAGHLNSKPSEDNQLGGDQYWEFMGSRAYISGRHKLVTQHRPMSPIDESEWQLYDLIADPTETKNIAAQHPEIVQKISALWKEAAWENQVFPMLDDAAMLRTVSSEIMRYREPLTIYPGTPQLERFRSSSLTSMRSFEVQTKIIESKSPGVLLSHGDQGGGYVIFVEDGELRLSYNEAGRMHRVGGKLAAGETDVLLRFTALPEMAWNVKLFGNGILLGEVPTVMISLAFTPFTGISIGADVGGPVDWELHRKYRTFPYEGKLFPVTYLPGAVADYNDEIVIDLLSEQNRLYD